MIGLDEWYFENVCKPQHHPHDARGSAKCCLAALSRLKEAGALAHLPTAPSAPGGEEAVFALWRSGLFVRGQRSEMNARLPELVRQHGQPWRVGSGPFQNPKEGM